MQLRSDTGSRIVYCLIALSTLAIGVYTPSCARSHDPEHLFDEHIENGIRIAETHGGPRFLGDLFKFEEVLQLREGDSEDAHLYRPSGFFRDKDGFFYVMDGGNNRIAVFNPEGGYVRQFGREGDGPGEFRGASLKYLHAGILNLYSLRQSRSTRFKADGTLLDVTHLPGAPSLSVLACSRLDAERAIFAKLTSTQADRIEMWVEFGVFTTTGDSVWTGRTNPCEMGMMESVEFQGISAPQPRLYQLGSTPTAVYHPSTGLVPK